MAVSRNNKRSAIRRNGRGMTLVEIIVVLAILAILASAGIVSAVGYVKRTRIDQNQSNAETIYQAAQTALQQLNKSGGIQSTMEGKNGIVSEDVWVGYVISYGKPYSINANNLSPAINNSNRSAYDELYSGTFNASIPNSSAHRIYLLTYFQKNTDEDQNKLVKELIQPYFADSTVFQGTITIELDVEKSADAYGNTHLSAKCLSVFYDSRSKSGWSSNAYRVTDGVPTRDAEYRQTKSYVGYHDGYKGAGVDTVYLPKVEKGIVVQKFIAEYETVTPTPDPNVTPPVDPDPANPVTTSPTPTPVIHTRLTWAATIDHATLNNVTLEHKSLLGIQQSVYYRIVLKSPSGVERVLILNEEFLLDKDNIDGIKHSFDYFSKFAEEGVTKINGYDVTTEEYTAVYPEDVTSTVTRKSIEVMAQVFVSNFEEDGYRGKKNDQILPTMMPLRITYVDGELDYKDADHHEKKEPYIEYSLDLTGEGDSYVLNDKMSEAILTIYPNYFTHSTMTGINDTTGIIPFKKGISTEIDQEQTKLPEDTNTGSPP